MSANDILMDGASALGPIDAQMSWQGKRFSAGALITGLEQIKQEAAGSAGLNQAYIPMLQMISPGEIVGAQNALAFVEGLVADWLVKYKFHNWTEHSSTGAPVTDDEREERAKEIAGQLRDHSRWQTHGRIDPSERFGEDADQGDEFRPRWTHRRAYPPLQRPPAYDIRHTGVQGVRDADHGHHPP